MISAWQESLFSTSFGVLLYLMRLISYIRKRVLWLVGGLLLLVLGCLALFWFLVHHRLRESLRLLVAKESKGRFAFEAGEADISFSRGILHLRDVRLYTPDTAGQGIACDIRIPEVYLSLASWKALIAEKKLLVDSLAIRSPFIWVRTSIANRGSSQRPWQLEDGKAALDSTLHRLNVHTFSLLGGQLRLDGPDSASRFQARDIEIVIKDFARGAGAGLRFVASHSFILALSSLHWAGPGAIQRLSVGKLRWDSHSQRFEADSVDFQQQSGAEEEPFRLLADRCYFKAKDLAAALADQRFLLDTLVCINPVLREPVSRSGAAPISPKATIRPVYIAIRFVGVVNGQALLYSKDGSKTNFSTRRADCRIYGLSIDASRKFPIRTDSVRVRLDKLMFTTKDQRYALTIDNFGLEGNDAVFRGVHYGPVRENTAGVTTFTTPLLRLRNVDIERLLQGHLHATEAELTAPRVVMTQKEGAEVPGTPGNISITKRKIALFYHTLHNLKEIIDAGSLYISDGEIHYTRAGGQPIDAHASGLKAHILLNGIFGSDDLLEIKHAIPDAELDDFHALIGGQEVRISRYRLAGIRRHSEEKEIEIILKNGWTLLGRRVDWAALDWDIMQRNGVIRIDSLHIGRIDIRRTENAPPPWPPATNQIMQPQATNRPTQLSAMPGLDVSGLSIDTLSFDQTDGKQQTRFAADGLLFKGIRTIDNSIHWEQAAVTLHDFIWQNNNTRFTAKQINLDSRKGLIASGVEGRGQTGQGRLEVSAPLVLLETAISSPVLPQNSMLRIPAATIRFGRLIDRDSLELGAELEMAARLPSLNPSRIYSLDLSLKNSWVNLRSPVSDLRVTGLAGSLHADTLRMQAGQQPDWQGWLRLTTIDQATVHYDAPSFRAEIQALSWHPAESTLRLAKIGIHPTIGRDSFFRRSQWQGDYVTGSAAGLLLQGLQFKGGAKKPAITIASIRVDGAAVEASRNKNIPFHHGIEKSMPTKLLASIPMDINVYRIDINGSQVVYNELSAITGRWGRITLDDLDATIGPLTSRSGNTDTLTLDASAHLFDGHIRRFRYRESYADPNSGFDARASFSPLDLTRLSDISSPAAAVTITGGHIDTAWSVWRGNRYAAYGFMGLRYRDLRIRVLDKKDSTRTGFLPSLETFAANILLPGHSRRGSVIYFERNPEKFVFNYWVKTQTSGIISTLVHKKNDAYRRLYIEHSRQYFLPHAGLSAGPW